MDKRRVNVRAIIWHDNKLLAVKHKTADGGEANYWALPGGGLDPKESLPNGIERELLEETGIEAKVGRLLFIQQFRSEQQHRDEELEFFYHIENSEDFTVIEITNTTHGMEELARIEFIDPTQEYILPQFLSSINSAEYVSTTKPVYLHIEL